MDYDRFAPNPDPLPEEHTPRQRKRLRERFRATRRKAGEKKQSLLERAEKEGERHDSVRTALILLGADRARGGGLLAGGLAYRLFLWVLPAALASTSLVSVFSTLTDDSPAEVAKGFGMGGAFATTIARAAAQTGRAAWILFAIGAVLMVWAARSCLKAFRLVSTLAWNLPRVPVEPWFRQTIALTLILLLFPTYPIVLTPLYAGGLLADAAATLLSTTGLLMLGAWGAAHTPHPDGMRWFEFLPGAALFAIGIEALRLTTAVYFTGKLERIDDLYGAIGLSAVFMTYIYLVARLTVLGYMMNAAVWRVRYAEGGTQE